MKRGHLFFVLLVSFMISGAGLFNKKNDVRIIDGIVHPYKASSLAIGEMRDLENRTIIHDRAPIMDLERYLNAKLNVIKQTANLSDVPSKVILTAGRFLNADTTADGNIYLGIGFIQNITTEDEVMALLAHEFAHAAFNHTNSDMLAKMQQHVISSAEMVSKLKKKMDGVSSSTGLSNTKLDKNLRNADLALQVTKTAILPAWQREQEVQADFFAVDITQKAGYSYARGMKSFLELLQNEDTLENALRKQNQEKLEQNLAEQVGAVDNKSDIFSGLKSFGNGIQEQMLGMLAKNHYAAEKRLEKTNAYYERFYGEDGLFQNKTTAHEKEWLAVRNTAAVKKSLDSYRTVFEADNDLDVLETSQGLRLVASTDKSMIAVHPYRIYVLARALKQSGDYKHFEQVYDDAARGGPVSWKLVQLRTEYELSKGDKANATRIVEDQYKRRGNPVNAMPYMHEFYVHTGNSDKALTMQFGCQFSQGKSGKECSSSKARGKN